MTLTELELDTPSASACFLYDVYDLLHAICDLLSVIHYLWLTITCKNLFLSLVVVRLFIFLVILGYFWLSLTNIWVSQALPDYLGIWGSLGLPEAISGHLWLFLNISGYLYKIKYQGASNQEEIASYKDLKLFGKLINQSIKWVLEKL